MPGGMPSSATFNDIGGAVSDLFSSQEQAESLDIKAMGEFAEGKEYDLASQLATQNEKFTETSTAIKEVQAGRQIYQTIGGQRSDIAGAGLAESGSAIDLLRSSAQQGALTQAVLGQQGLIQEAGYEEQANAYTLMSQTATQTGQAEQKLAGEERTAGMVNAGIKGAAAIASLFV